MAVHQSGEAVVEFQEILDHRGIVLNQPTGALAHLQLGRAYAMAGDTSKAGSAYQDFFALWKDADPDIPILQEAKAEYAKVAHCSPIIGARSSINTCTQFWADDGQSGSPYEE